MSATLKCGSLSNPDSRLSGASAARTSAHGRRSAIRVLQQSASLVVSINERSTLPVRKKRRRRRKVCSERSVEYSFLKLAIDLSLRLPFLLLAFGAVQCSLMRIAALHARFPSPAIAINLSIVVAASPPLAIIISVSTTSATDHTT